MKQEVIKFKNVSKAFKIPHEKKDTLKAYFIDLLRNLDFETFNALDNVNFSVYKGECLGVIGSNGSGKSTILKVASGIYLPTSGNVGVLGRISPFIELAIGFQYDLTGKDNIYLYGAILGMDREEIYSKYEEIVKFSGIEKFIDQKMKNYSSGMQMRLAFSIISHTDADILLIDEALAVGDENFQKKCIDKIKEFKSVGKTIIFVSHDLDQIKKICDRVVWLEKGTIKAIEKSNKAVSLYLNEAGNL